MRITNSRIETQGHKAVLYADIHIENYKMTPCFFIAEDQADYLTMGRADPFVVLMLPMAMRMGQDIVCDMPVSRRLVYQLNGQLVPMLANYSLYHRIRVLCDTCKEKYNGLGHVGTGFSGGVDSLYSVMTHGPGSERPLQDVAVFNNGVFSGMSPEDEFRVSIEHARSFADRTGLGCVCLDTNFGQVLPERFLDVYSFRNMACVLALQGLFSAYLCSSGSDAAHFRFDMHNCSSYDMLLTRSLSTESMTFYGFGEEVRRVDKLKALSEWAPSYDILHPCFKTMPGQKNCGHCKKCVRDMSVLESLGKLDSYSNVYDVADYRKNQAQRIGVLLAHSDGFLYQEALDFIRAHGMVIPERSRVYERQFRAAMACLKERTGNRE